VEAHYADPRKLTRRKWDSFGTGRFGRNGTEAWAYGTLLGELSYQGRKKNNGGEWHGAGE